MNYEENRLCTFDNWPPNAPVESGKLAKEGFFATGRYLEVECFWCHCRISSWEYRDQVEERHRQLQPQCPFLLNRHTCNNRPLTNVRTTTEVSTNCCHQSDSLFIEANRLATFKNWPNKDITPESLAKAGFYYLNRDDEAKCAWCKGVIAKWEKNDNAFNEHQRFFPHCPRVQLGPLIEMASDGIRDLGIQQITPPKEPKYSSLDARLRTYEKWPIANIQDPLDLAQAGLYYQNISDQVRCFHCNIGLRSWQKDDNPWFEHTKWYPDCQFIRLVKGPKYIEQVLQATSEKRDNETSNAITPQPISINEAMSTQPVRHALEMGIDAGAIRNVTQKQLIKKGQPFTNVDELVQAVFDVRHEHEEEHSVEHERVDSMREENLNILNDHQSQEDFEELNLINIESDLSPHPSTSSSSNSNNNGISTQVSSAICLEQGLIANDVTLVETKHESPITKVEASNINEQASALSLEEENRKLKDARLCKVCLDEEVGVVFLPCGHLVTCVQCAPGVNQCPMCRTEIKGYVRTFLS